MCRGYALVTEKTYRDLVSVHLREQSDCTILSAESKNPAGYGRILRGADSSFEAIVEERDCTPEQRGITEINSSIYVFDSKSCFQPCSMLLPTTHRMSTI